MIRPTSALRHFGSSKVVVARSPSHPAAGHGAYGGSRQHHGARWQVVVFQQYAACGAARPSHFATRFQRKEVPGHGATQDFTVTERRCRRMGCACGPRSFTRSSWRFAHSARSATRQSTSWIPRSRGTVAALAMISFRREHGINLLKPRSTNARSRICNMYI